MRGLHADDSEEGDLYYNEEEVLNGIGAENRAALLERYDAMLDDSEQPELEQVHYVPYCIAQQQKASAAAVLIACSKL